MGDIKPLTISQKAAIKDLLLNKYFTGDKNTRTFLLGYLKRQPIDERAKLEPLPEAIKDLEKILQS